METKVSKNKKEVTSYKYFCRALSFTSKHIGLVTITVACLLVNCGTNLVLPHYTGRILDSVAKQDVSDFTNDIKFYIICATCTGFFGAIRSLTVTITGRKIAADIRHRLFANIMVQDISFLMGK